MTGRERPSLALSASKLIGPATTLVAIGVVAPMAFLLRYILNPYDPRLLMVEALSPSNDVDFFMDG